MSIEQFAGPAVTALIALATAGITFGVGYVTLRVMYGRTREEVAELARRADVTDGNLAAYKLHVSETYVRKDDFRDGLREVKDSIEGVRKSVLDAIAATMGSRRGGGAQ